MLVHERAHLAGRHHQLVALADALRTALPFLPLFRDAPGALRELVELAADVAATRRCGPRGAVGAGGGVRLRGAGDRAGHGAGRRGRAARASGLGRCAVRGSGQAGRPRGGAGVLAALLPFVVGAALTISAALTACLLGLV
ncbi:hypothetical protein ACWEKJ_35815 [Amycolatopsis thermoflava]